MKGLLNHRSQRTSSGCISRQWRGAHAERWTRSAFAAVAVSAALLFGTGCLPHARGHTGQLPGLTQVGEQFRANAGRDRFSEGEKIHELLPECPQLWNKDIGTGTLVAYDYSRPTYKLMKRQVMQILGRPDAVNNQAFLYDLKRDPDGMFWQLIVFLHDDYVTGSMVMGLL